MTLGELIPLYLSSSSAKWEITVLCLGWGSDLIDTGHLNESLVHSRSSMNVRCEEQTPPF